MSTPSRDLRRSFTGPVHRPGDAGYDRERATWSGHIDQRPALVAEATSAADVRAALLIARQHGLRFAVQGTGHGTHVPCDGGLLVKTGRLRGVLVDPARRIARVGAGATWGDVVAAAAPFGLAPLAGSSPTVGVAGFTLGGGVGWLARRFGFAADSLVAAEVVAADGELVRTDADRHPDLFWGLRGGGGNLAVVTALELRLFPLRSVVAGTIAFAAERAADVLATFRDGADRPDALSATVVLQRDAATIRALYAGPVEQAREPFGPLLHAGGAPVAVDLRECAFADAALGGTAPRHFELLEELPVEAILAAASIADAVEVRQWGGAMEAAGAGAGPVGHRHVPWSVTIDGSAEAAARVRPHATGGSFLNFLADQSRTGAAYTRADLLGLRAVKQAWDPDNVLGLTHNIAPAVARAAA
jgi:FAD/FMN-containing dehydrogenase